MITVLLDAKTASETAAAAGAAVVDTKTAAALRSRYHGTLDVAMFLLPDGPKPRRRHQGAGRSRNERHGTSPHGCAPTPTRSSGSSTTPASRSTTTSQNER